MNALTFNWSNCCALMALTFYLSWKQCAVRKTIVILSRADAEERILLTEDKDFGELVFRLRKPAIGIILLRFNPGEETQKATRLYQLLHNSTISLIGAFIVVESDRIRTRPLIS